MTRLAIVFCLLVFMIGCGQQGGLAIDELKQANARLTAQLDASGKRMKAAEEKVAAMEARWKVFEQAFDSEKRDELSENTRLVEMRLMDADQKLKMIDKTLLGARDDKKAIEGLLQQCKEYEAEARDATLVTQIQSDLGKINGEIARLRQSVRRAESKAQTAMSRAMRR